MSLVRLRPVQVLPAAAVLAALAVVAPVATPEPPTAASVEPEAGAAAPRPAPQGLPEETRPLRILVVGDSISHGQTGSATWRYWLWRESLRQGRDIQMVGPDPWPARGRTYEHLDHGFTEQWRHGAIAGSGYERHIKRIPRLIREHRPHVILAELGFNDLQVRETTSARRTARLAMTFTRRVLAAGPRVHLVLSEIPSTSRRVRWWPGFARDKNALAARADRRVDAALARLGSPRVTRTDVRTDPRRPWRPARFTYDGSHPNSTGETVLAEHFADALHEIGQLPLRPRVFHREAWEPRPRFNALQRRPGAVTLWWGKDARRIYADTYTALVRVGRTVRRFTPRPNGAIVVELPRGRYAVRMVARRGSMVSRPGPKRWVRIGGAARAGDGSSAR